MNKAYPLSNPMAVRSFDPNIDMFDPKNDDEHINGLEVPYLNAIGALMYLL